LRGQGEKIGQDQIDPMEVNRARVRIAKLNPHPKVRKTKNAQPLACLESVVKGGRSFRLKIVKQKKKKEATEVMQACGNCVRFRQRTNTPMLGRFKDGDPEQRETCVKNRGVSMVPIARGKYGKNTRPQAKRTSKSSLGSVEKMWKKWEKKRISKGKKSERFPTQVAHPERDGGPGVNVLSPCLQGVEEGGRRSIQRWKPVLNLQNRKKPNEKPI